MLTWGPFYFHSYDKAKARMEEIIDWIVKWVNEKDNTLNIRPQNKTYCTTGNMIIFNIEAWKDEKNLQGCDGIVTVEDIFFEDEKGE